MDVFESNVNDFVEPRAGDEKLAIRFFTKAKQNTEESQKAGRPIFKEVDYIQIMIPGDRNNTIVRPVTPQDQDRFRRQYEHWKNTQKEEAVTGTPLEAWGLMSLAQIEEYRYYGIRTIDQLADLRDDVCQKIMGSATLKQKAQAFLDAMKAEAPLKQMQAELSERDNKIEALEKALADQGAILKDLQAGKETAAGAKRVKA